MFFLIHCRYIPYVFRFYRAIREDFFNRSVSVMVFTFQFSTADLKPYAVEREMVSDWY
jgi:hypothetical protein